METPGEIGAAGTVLSARLFFMKNSLPETALKVARLIEGARASPMGVSLTDEPRRAAPTVCPHM
jgi:hypothetical protein